MFAQVVRVIANACFDNATETVAILSNICRKSGTSTIASNAYKLDQCAQWWRWTGQLGVKLRYLSGPNAPHSFKMVRRCDLGLVRGLEYGHLGLAECSIAIDDFPPSEPKDRCIRPFLPVHEKNESYMPPLSNSTITCEHNPEICLANVSLGLQLQDQEDNPSTRGSGMPGDARAAAWYVEPCPRAYGPHSVRRCEVLRNLKRFRHLSSH